MNIEKERLERELEEKMVRKREGLRGWDKAERESRREELKGSLASGAVRALEEGMDGGAAF